ncbi:hypothetical protein [Pseudoalteromonas sp. T1lg24]|uniref:hypothetical protein n=1 Tax=Pseudoalteromonas sp. T1lg24 TaxID=2077099 RepID=UPI000CF5E676|nr:hypothetical protein [Pseudoalteromonas sp. T1lg24]
MKIFSVFLVLVVTFVMLVTFSNRVQVFLLYNMYSLGSGMDDGAAELFIQNKHRYKPVVLDLLNADDPNTYKAQASFLFGEFLLDDPDINKKTQELSRNHTNKHIRCFWSDVLNGRFEQVRIGGDEGDKFAAYVMKDNGSKCK